MSKKLKRIIIFAFILRFAVAFISEHGDAIQYYWWTKDVWENGFQGLYSRSFLPEVAQPNYPPVSYYMFWLSAAFHELVWQISWFLNTTISLFPSNFIFWLESAKAWYISNKLLCISFDIALVYLLYLFGKDLKNEKTGLLTASLFAFSPPFWYNSALWGQTESMVALLVLAAFYLLHKKRVVLSTLVYGLAMLTKPTALLTLPAFAFWLLKKAKFPELVKAAALVLLEILVLYFPFHPQNLVSWIIEFYSKNLGGQLSYMVANAFNLWGFMFGFDKRPDTSLFLGIPAYRIGYGVYILILIFSFWYFWKKKKFNLVNILFLATITAFAAFLFMPRMHERYFYPALVMLVPLAGLDKKMRNLFWTLSIIHFINLYHFWWVPKIKPVIVFLSFQDHLIPRILGLVNVFLFFYLFRYFFRQFKPSKI